MYLTKSDFTVAQTCPTKLYYKKRGYPSLLDDDPYLEFLSDGGFMVEAMARQLFPNGLDLGASAPLETAIKESSDAIEAGDGTYYEATVAAGTLLARIDILLRVGNELQLIEVKSSSVDSAEDLGKGLFRGKKGGIVAKWQPKLEDVAFQVLVLRRAFPSYSVKPFLCVVDKAKNATTNSTFDKFHLKVDAGATERASDIEYLGDADALREECVLVVADVSSEVDEIISTVELAADKFAATVTTSPVTKLIPEIGQECKRCEYRNPGHRSGFNECWGALATKSPHVLELYRGDALKSANGDAIAELASNGKASLFDVLPESIQGAFAARQTLQIEHSRNATEYRGPTLAATLSGHAYPLHFIDFEASRLAIPYHAGMRPYELAAFQWSCHRIETAGSAVTHHEWLNDTDAFPNFDFAKSLMALIGDRGTIYIWSSYEVSVLKEIRTQMAQHAAEADNHELATWLDSLLAADGNRFVDLLKLATTDYFHPLMKGSLSIKDVLPAIWSVGHQLYSHPELSRFVSTDEHGNLRNPYKTLELLPIGAKEEVVNEGTGAMRVYQEMMFGRTRLEPNSRENYKKLLLQYCRLDTAAMLAIWLHWNR